MRLYSTFARSRVFLLILCILIISLATSCRGAVESSLTEAAKSFPFDLLLHEPDLPPGWHQMRGPSPDVPGADSRLVEFRVSNKPEDINLLISQQLTIYPSEEAAHQAYTSWEQEWFWDDRRPPVAQFVPHDSSDQFRLGCHYNNERPEFIGVCTYLQQHKQFVSLIIGHPDGERFIFSQFEAVLKRADERLGSR